MPLPIDPFTQIYDKIVMALRSHKGLSSLVKVGNFVSFSGEQEPRIKQEPMAADFPEVSVIPGIGGQFSIFGSSSHCAFTQNFSIGVTTGTLRLSAAIFPVKWQILRAMSALEDNLGLAFVNKVRVTDSSETVQDKEMSRGIEGWTGIVLVGVEGRFLREDVISGAV